jgi:D-alanyl-D-alanine carboxypeptidase (penicillin-binding protein 5/6)
MPGVCGSALIFCSPAPSEIAHLSLMFPPLFRPSLVLAASLIASAVAAAAPARQPARSSATAINPNAFRSAIVIDAATGNVLFEDRADVQNPPASVTKLMTFFLVEDRLKKGELTLDTPVAITAEASHTGGSRVWLVDKEKITVEELLYALMVHSANDAAVALADHLAGSKAAFVDLMNLKAQELGMRNTVFHSPHGLPPGKGQEPDQSTARDIATLARKLIVETDVLKYSSTAHRDFRHQNGKVIKLDTHNHLLGVVPGCDGLKTGYYREAGFSLAATVQRGNRRIIAVILGSPERKLRDTVTTQLIERGFAALPAAPPTAAAPAALPATTSAPPSASAPAQTIDSSSTPQLIPVGPGEQKPPPSADTSTEPTVHVDLPGHKK